MSSLVRWILGRWQNCGYFRPVEVSLKFAGIHLEMTSGNFEKLVDRETTVLWSHILQYGATDAKVSETGESRADLDTRCKLESLLPLGIQSRLFLHKKLAARLRPGESCVFEGGKSATKKGLAKAQSKKEWASLPRCCDSFAT